ncbi:MAG: N-acetylmuramoyl-L-alanine amidase [Endomicrobiales bacterium]|nr:N-acetylmuramoyl-L-alanine amidase [Endomicrobiales bacterium]
MRNKFKLLISCFIFIISFSPYALGKLEGRKVKVILDGRVVSKDLEIYNIKGDEYFAIREASKIYGARVVWHPVTGKVSALMHNDKLDFYIKSTKVVHNKKKISLDTPNHIISGKLYVPADFIFSEHFADFTKTDSHWNDETGILTIEHRNNISTPRFYSSIDSTRIVIELTEKIPYYFEESNSNRIFITFHRGTADKERIKVDDGVIKEIVVKPRGRQVLVTIYKAPGAGKVKKSLNEDSYKLEIDIERTELAGEFVKHEVLCPEPAAGLAATSAPVSISGMDETELQNIPVFTEPDISGTKKIVVLDAGHGGEDPGAIGKNGTKEKDINLSIVKELKRIFEEDKSNNYEVILTRTDDTFIPLVERTNFANEKKADLFVSVHCNASMKPKSNGFEIYFLSEKASDSDAHATAVLENSVVRLEGKPSKKRAQLQELLWSMVVNEFINESSELCCFISQEVPKRIEIENRGVKQAGFHVLRGAQMPAVLVECAFISNLEEEAKLRSGKFKKKIADAIYEGIKGYERRKNILNAKK